MADPAIFLASDSVLGPYSENSWFIQLWKNYIAVFFFLVFKKNKNSLTVCWWYYVVFQNWWPCVGRRNSLSLNSSCAPGAPKLEVSNQGKFVVLEVDGSNGLVVGMQSEQTEEVLTGKLRLALGGILIDKDAMIVQVSRWDKFYFYLSRSIDEQVFFLGGCN